MDANYKPEHLFDILKKNFEHFNDKLRERTYNLVPVLSKYGDNL